MKSYRGELAKIGMPNPGVLKNPLAIGSNLLFKILSDGTAGDHYFTYKNYYTGNVTETVENELGPNLWSYDSPVDLKNYAAAGISSDNVIYAKCFTVKSLAVEGKVETQTVSQTTTLIWKTGDGSIQSKQFVSMHGVHKKILPSN
jgi:hypothetical protein